MWGASSTKAELNHYHRYYDRMNQLKKNINKNYDPIPFVLCVSFDVRECVFFF